jgi:hypothetical protein
MDRTGLKILENNKNIQSIISVNTNILLRRFRLKFLRIMCSTSCYKERVNFENTLYNETLIEIKDTFLQKLNIYSKRLKRYKNNKQRKFENKLFRNT